MLIANAQRSSTINRKWLVGLALCSANAALAQDPGVSVSVGARAWYTEWTTFSYFVDENTNENLALTQVSASSELAIIPIVSVRYRDFVGSISGIPSTDFSFDDGSSGTREEFDANIGYFVMPGLALTLGYKKVSQSGDAGRYRPAGSPAAKRSRLRWRRSFWARPIWRRS